MQPEPGDEYTAQTAVYPLIDTYTNRSVKPDYMELSTIIDDHKQQVIIDPQTLTIPNQEPTVSEIVLY